MENFNKCNIEIDVEHKGCNKNVSNCLIGMLNRINLCFENENNNFAELCYYVYQVWGLFLGNNFFDKKGNYLTFHNIMQQFGLNAVDVSRLKACYDKFMYVIPSESGTVILEYGIKSEFKEFSKSKLFELLTVPNEQLVLDINQKVLRPDMSLLTIRQYVKNYKQTIKQNKKLFEQKEEKFIEEKKSINEEDIPMAFDPKQKYEFEYFKTMSKNQIINIAWDIYQAYQKLLKEKKKNGK